MIFLWGYREARQLGSRKPPMFPAGLAPALGLLLAGLLTACGQQLTPATIELIDQAEASWQANPILNYDIIVDVDRPDERQRNEISVRQGQVTRAVTLSWDYNRMRWQASAPLNPEQAFPFTVPGLFDMVRGQLRASGRADIRVAMGEAPAFPQRLVLGPVWQDGQPVGGTEATVSVRHFELISEED